MDWHNIPEDFEESPHYSEQEFKNNDDLGNELAYREINYASPRPVITQTRIAQDDLEAFFRKMEQPSEPLPAKRITQPMTVEFNFKPKIDTSQDTRNRLYLGSVSTTTQRHLLWGFDTWQEFRDHLHPEDLALARELHEHIMADLATLFNQTGMFKRRLWTIHEDTPVAGYWAMTIDLLAENQRLVFSIYNNRKYINEATIITKNELYYNPKQWMEI